MGQILTPKGGVCNRQNVTWFYSCTLAPQFFVDFFSDVFRSHVVPLGAAGGRYCLEVTGI